MKLILKYFMLITPLILVLNANADKRYVCCTPGFNELTSCLEYSSKEECNKFCNSKCVALSADKEEMEEINKEKAENPLSEIEIA